MSALLEHDTQTARQAYVLRSFYDLAEDPTAPGDDFARLVYNGYGIPHAPSFATPTQSGDYFEGRAEVHISADPGDYSGLLVLTDAATWHAYMLDDFMDALDLAMQVYRETRPNINDDAAELRSVSAMLATLATLPGVEFDLTDEWELSADAAQLQTV